MRGLQLIAFSLLVLVFLVESQAATRQCNRLNASFLPNCINNSVVKITKSAEMYQVTLLATEWQCFGEFCLVSDLRHQKRNILCNETCRACHQLKPMSGCGTDKGVCEVNVDTYLDDFCAQATTTRNSATTYNATTIIKELPCPTRIITSTPTVQPTTVTVSTTLPHQCNTNSMIRATPRPNVQCGAPSPSESTGSQTLASDCKPVLENYYQYPLVALGALQGLSLVVLALVTTGWVCTCRSMKKREARKSSTCTRTTYVNGYGNDGDDDDDKTNEERLFQNPTYDDTHTSPTAQPYEEMALQGSVEPLIDEGIPETKYDSVNLPTRSAEDDREMYDVLNRSQANGGSNLTTEARAVHDNANYSQLQGFQEK